jgi:pyruvate dehydrogenase phosphatase
MAGVLDGHGGWQVAEYVSKRIEDELLLHLEGTDFEDEWLVEEKIQQGFSNIEQSYLEKVKDSFGLGYGEVAKVGCCVLVAFRSASRLALANAGDCRAILASQVTDSDQTLALRITNDHNCREPLEDLKLRREHPGEDDVVRCKSPHACYVKGRLQLTRALGDAYLKYSSFNAPLGKHRSAGRHIPGPYTPPYVDHKPQIHHIELTPQDKFLVLASDGVWDFLTDQQAVDIVCQCGHNATPGEAAEAIVQAALIEAAKQSGFTTEELKGLKQGRERRCRHDDTTAVVLYL